MSENCCILRVFYVLFLPFIFSSCKSDWDRKLNISLTSAGTNRIELESVIKHYQKEKDEEKVRAAIFLISNMNNKLSIINRSNRSYLEVFDFIDSLWTGGNASIMDNANRLEAKWDSLKNIYGLPKIRKVDQEFDINIIKAKYLIAHIDHAFNMWRGNKWSAKVDFESFCEYILPYKIGTEPNELWSTRLYNIWRQKVRENKLDSILNIARFINDQNTYRMSHARILWSYPYDFKSSEFERIRLGSCKNGVQYITQSLRALGIPTAIDFTRKWAGSNNGHEWNVIFLEDGRQYPFDAINKGLKIDLSWRKIAKVFRKTYTNQHLLLDPVHAVEIPVDLLDSNSVDVTKQYVMTRDILARIDNKEENKYAIISTYNGFSWEPQTWAEIFNGQVLFKDMGVKNLYSIFLFDGIDFIRKTEPFFLDSVGKIQYFKPSFERESIRLERKARLTPFMEGIMGFIVNNKFQGANTLNFQDSVTLFSIQQKPKKIESVIIEQKKRFRYARMWIPRGGRGDIAELEFYGLSRNNDTIKLDGRVIGDPSIDISKNRYYNYPFDNDLLTYFLKPKAAEPWVGLDFGRPERIVKIRYCPRSDTNFIEVGNEYELFYWNSENWESLGRQVARDQFVKYHNVPKNSLFILINTNKGKEYTIFTYKMGKQIWL